MDDRLDELPLDCCRLRFFDWGGRQEMLSCGFLRSSQARKRARTAFPTPRLLYLLGGSGRYVDHHGRACPLAPGDLVYRAADTLHTIERDPAGWCEFYLVLPRFVHDDLTRLGVLDPAETFFRPGLLPELYPEIRRCLELLDSAVPLDLAEAVLKAQEILLRLLRAARSGAAVRPAGSTMLRRARMLLDDVADRRLPMTAVAERLGMGYESFRKEFRRLAGMPPRAYCVDRRIRRAKLLLLNHELEIKEIADLLGYPDAAAFVKQFRQVCGQTPRRYRSGGD